MLLRGANLKLSQRRSLSQEAIVSDFRTGLTKMSFTGKHYGSEQRGCKRAIQDSPHHGCKVNAVVSYLTFTVKILSALKVAVQPNQHNCIQILLALKSPC